MNNVIDKIGRLTLGRLLLLLSVLSVTFAIVLIFFISDIVRDQAAHEFAREDTKPIAQTIFQSLYSVMRKGWNKGEIEEVINRLDSAMPGTTIRVYRGHIVGQQFGEIVGEQAIIRGDPRLVGIPEHRDRRFRTNVTGYSGSS